MATQTDIPPDLSDSDKAFMFQFLDDQLNSSILFALLHGIYTGILSVTLWNIFINKCSPRHQAPVIIIILLHALTTISFAVTWSFICSTFIQNGQSFWTVFSKLDGVNRALYLEQGIAACMSTILADSYIIWCCWMVWGQRWLIILLPILSLISATVLKIIEVYYGYLNAANPVYLMPYSSLILATTLWCTLLIIFRIFTVTRVRHGGGSRLRVYHHFIQVLVESSTLYSISLILYLALFYNNTFRWYCLDTITAIARGVAPTLLVGRAAAGHTCPTEKQDESATVSTLRFQMSSQSSQPSQPSTSSFQESTRQSAVLEMDIEAQMEQSDEFMVVVEKTQ
ncbi:uncharacterized protein EV420DRAFT_1770374 [Desarmillaria tabescens]|uniref:Uncharacterized protein n=1 Tax=Armillaria tabescens TaxID=1929756 RepID=A0AA39J4M0_ARMTA|nr:uncharacterized protein EV420DRAFT_1770374 [Desarmillaria tabescens]KAK0436057.1 hypothetical protein EV420DRAFT_1770374 [Desarmillaria tabescens]